MALPRGRTLYKKKDGILTLTEDRNALIWTPMPATGPPTVCLALENIMNLQQTPDGSPKVVLRVIEKPKPAAGEGAAPSQFLFQFTSPTDARAEANAIRDLLSQLLTANRENDPSVPRPVAGGPADGAGPSAALSFASTANAKAAPPKWFDDALLKADAELQQSLMRKDEALAQTYADALALKPPSLSEAAFNAQFWSARLGLLRAHAIELNQKKGAYNVLSTIKPRTEDGQFRLNITSEQISMILQQHPLVRRIYNENVPKLTESDFWSRFFLSKLSKKLRGERITENDNSDVIFDRYLEADNSFGYSKITAAQRVPHMIDLEANEENQGGLKTGNRKDVEMRPRGNVPIIKTLNSLSEKIMANVAPSDLDPSAPASLIDDDRALDALTLRDLRGDKEAARIILNVREQSRFFSSNQDGLSDETRAYEKQVPSEVLFEVQADLETLEDDGSGGLDLRKSIGVDDEEEDDEDEDENGAGAAARPTHVGSRAARKKAQDQILEGMRKKRSELHDVGGGSLADGNPSPMSIPPDIAERCVLTNATTTEFLRQFWTAFLSGDAAASAQEELAYYAESLRRSAARIDALAAEAEHARQLLIERRKKEIKEYYERTRKKLRWQPPKGGKESVMALFEGTVTALNAALEMYAQAKAQGGKGRL
ncbi:hypothetical protein VTJ83DRAFT_6674 [Remersonia thermophila]|uniref:BSD domain-containing protein n=1 Tax=Remersonia thermophila TaxID=72144 RepID=A0ABR4D7K9_9PEZI